MKTHRPYRLSARQLFCLCIMFLFAPGLAVAQSSTVTTQTASLLAGTATASPGETITVVDLAIRNGSDFWNGSSFQSGWIRLRAEVTGNTWSYNINPSLPQGGLYRVSVRAIDSGGNIQSPNTATSIATDSGRPTSTITSASASRINGDATDNPGGSGVSRVEIALRNSDSEFWNGSAFVSGYRRVTTNLSANGSWSYNISPTITTAGRYAISAIAFDVAGNVQQSPFTSTSFVVTSSDNVRPTSTITSATGEGISGSASDNSSGIVRVELAIRRGSEYWDGSAFRSGYTRVPATVTGGGASVNWNYAFTPTLPVGSYSLAAVAFDAAGNAQQPFTTMVFNVEAATVLRVMALGDSITQGSHQGSGANTSIFSYRKRFTDLMNATTCNYEMVGSQLDTRSASSFRSPHEGYSGHRVDHFINGREANPGIDATMAAFDPDVVLLHLGSNDMFGGQTITSTISEMITVIDSILAANPDAVILVANVIPWFGESRFNDNVQDDIRTLGNQVIAMIRSYSSRQVRLANVRNGFLPFMMQQEDLIHPNSLGDNHVGNAFFAAMRAAFLDCGNL